jgi:hypothetical protein
MPCQEAALKDRSLMPLVSVTMQPSNLPIGGAPEPDVDDGALEDGALDAGELALVADAHAVINKAMAPSATAFLVTFRTVNPPVGVASRWVPGRPGRLEGTPSTAPGLRT